ncbi:Crotonobetainyl-CoA:carnitine CoA-transferase CaiB [Novosphingobium sp. CF614]|uniref:CaiB/BaiF CoA transferase family protein n=1 Tax=Novosphingobium sp. CF614 TaxID=1884364 RepID=UPI0008EE34A4|nr:CoA transferase [Novosphingobium sp. CF614]SFF96243.1 Crotonobetainyl-CoA:carnitine CoA-transferase CaiB [Novosphingobium sp. CF614]
MSKNGGPLEGVRVLELGRLIAAPFCGQILGDLGADVIKIERVGSGDDIRGYGPPFLGGKEGAGSASAFYLNFNRNKRSIAIDFGTPQGVELIRKLAAECDVFIENFKVGALVKYGLDEASLRKVREDIIYLSVSGFGQSGPYAGRPATDVVVQGMSGLMSVTGEADGPPNRVGVPVVDMMTGLYSAVSVVSALYGRAKGKRHGDWARVSLLDCGMAMMGSQAIIAQLSGEVPLRMGNDGQGSAPSGLFSCRDGEVLLQAGKDVDFAKLCGVLGMEHLLQDVRFAERARRVENYHILQPMLIEAIAKWDRQAFYDALVNVGVICGPVTNVAEALADPQVVANQVEVSAGHPDDPDLTLIGSPIRYGDKIDPVRRHPPRMGEHSAEILTELLGMDQAAIADLAASRAIQVDPG